MVRTYFTVKRPPFDEGGELFNVYDPIGGELFDVADPILMPRGAKEPADEEQKKQIPREFMMMVENVNTANRKRSAEPPTICEVPGDLTQGNKGAYIPKVVCIGPLLDSKRRTASMLRLDNYKCYCVSRLIIMRAAGTSEWSAEVHEPLLRKCFDLMMGVVPQVRASYRSVSSSKHTTTSDEQLATKMLLDGCFILYLLLKCTGLAKRSSGEGNSGNDDDGWTTLVGRSWVWGTVQRDLLLVSNQVPFLVLQNLFGDLGSDGDDDFLVNGGLQLFSTLHPRRLHSAPIACDHVHHLLHLFYLSIDFPPSFSPHHEFTRHKDALLPELTWWVPSAKELQADGVRFRPRMHGAASFLDVRFHRNRGILEIPPLQLFDYSETLFRNLIAFEQTYPATPGRITSYAIFMDCLLRTAEDVRLLHQSGVLVNHMNGKRKHTTLGFFSRLCEGARTSGSSSNYLAGVMDDVVGYHRERWSQWRAAVVTKPWLTTSVVASAILLALTVLQSFYTAYAYYNPTK